MSAPAAGEESWMDRNRTSEVSRGDWRAEERPAEPDDACTVCRSDGIEIDEWGLCAECRPGDEETCEEWTTRIKSRRPQCACTAPRFSPRSERFGRCPVHGTAWRERQ